MPAGVGLRLDGHGFRRVSLVCHGDRCKSIDPMSVQDFAMATEVAARRRLAATVALAALVVLLVLISLGIGPVRLSPLKVIEALFGGGSDVAQVIVREIRLPRTILAFAIGGILGLSGAALQGCCAIRWPRRRCSARHRRRRSGRCW